MKLLVRNLVKTTSEEKIYSLFAQYGAVQSCNLVLDKVTGESKGFAFVEMPKAGEAKAAIKNLNGYKLAGNFIRVKKAETTKANTQDITQAGKIAKKQIKVPEELQDNENNILNIYGTIKKSDNTF